MKKGIQRIFSEVSETYNLVNHVLTLGLDRRWRKIAAREAARARGSLWLDVCSGTGDMAINLSSLAEEKTRIVAIDFCRPMLAKIGKKSQRTKISLILGDAALLPFLDATFDLVTISFATRNINLSEESLIKNFKEFHRVLKPGGTFINLETSQPKSKFTKRLFHFYVQTIVKPVGMFISGSKAGYKYLSMTIPRFYNPYDLADLLKKAGFNDVKFKTLLVGISAIHTARK